MKFIDKILVAYDFSPASQQVLTTAIELAKTFKATVVPIHVLPEDISNEKVKSLLQQTAQEKLRAANEQLQREGVSTGKPILASGAPHGVIVEAALDTNANLIVIGSGGARQGDKFLLGTTAERIIQKSGKPVFVVKEGGLPEVRHILCPVDLSPTSGRALKNAIDMARLFKAKLTVLSVCELPVFGWLKSEADYSKEHEQRCAQQQEKLDAFLADFNLTGVEWAQETRKGSPAQEILDAITSHPADLLVIGTTGKTGLSRMVIGSVTEKVVREVPCSFVTLKAEDVVSLHLETNIRDIENHYETAKQLLADGFYAEAIDQYQLCLSINNMHAPSHFGIAKAYDKMGDPDRAEIYRSNGREVMDRMWDQKIEQEVRKLRGQ